MILTPYEVLSMGPDCGIIEMVKEGDMPLKSYTWTHGDAKLSQEQRALITNWAQSMMDSLQVQYPADSLVLKRK